jgi:hypothetical protein
MMHRLSLVRWSTYELNLIPANARNIGIALLISALVQSKTLGLYHMHILYDAISLVV